MKAFPNLNKDKHPDVTKDSEGMDLRDYFAAKAMLGLIEAIYQHEGHGWTHKDIAHDSYLIADAMMEARNDD